MKRLIIFLVRKKLGLKKFEKFQFTNQKSLDDVYFFSNDCIMKDTGISIIRSNVSLNWLLDDRCEIEKWN